MKGRIFLLIVIFMLALPVAAQSGGVPVDCTNGGSFENGVAVIVNMRRGFTYTATAVGLNGFDPVLAVLDESGTGFCEDDTPIASVYSANLPTTGQVTSSSLSAQVPFSQNLSDFADVTLVVGGFDNSSGEFVLILEGMAVTEADGIGEGAGDPFVVAATPNVLASGVPVTAYMIAETADLDAMITKLDSFGNADVDNAGFYVACDDAGDPSLCWGNSASLSGSYLTVENGAELGGFQYDAMLSFVPGESLAIDPEGGFIDLRFTSSSQASFGNYVAAFHLGTSGVNGQVQVPAQNLTPQVTEEPVPVTSIGTATGVSVDCQNGGSFDNGVELIVNMRPGFTYTATAIGINGFDPVLAVLDEAGTGFCEDDNVLAGQYGALLPTVGLAESTFQSAQVDFSHDIAGFSDVSIVVGGFDNSAGEFLLLVEGLAVTTMDGQGQDAGDPFVIHATPNVINSGVPITAYMISETANLDPLITQLDPQGNIQVFCDDAGTTSCYGASLPLTSSSVTLADGSLLGGYEFDAMLSLMPGETLAIDPQGGFIDLRFTSVDQNTFGDYLAAFHLGTTAAP